MKLSARDIAVLVALTAAAVAVHGYHIGVEDQAIYLPAMQQSLQPELFPHDADFFLHHTRLTLADEAVAATARFTHLPLDTALFVWHILCMGGFLYASLRLARLVFEEPPAQWAAVALMAALLTMPAAGTLVPILGQYAHPRALAAPLILYLFSAAFLPAPGGGAALRWRSTAACAALAFVIHPTMTAFGLWHFLWARRWKNAVVLLPPAAIFLAVPETWWDLAQVRRHLFPLRWTWYELLGAVAPMLFLWWFARMAAADGVAARVRLCRSLAISGSVGVAGAILISVLPWTRPLVPVEPMRVLHLVYVGLVLAGGGLIGRHILKARAWRWVLLFLPLCAGMRAAQRAQFPASPHIEWPGRLPANAWVEAFDWIRLNAPRDALFALDPKHMELNGEDFHGFRAFAQRSMLADAVKDRAVAIVYPEMEARWRREVMAREGWASFGEQNFLELRAKFGVTWVVVATGQPTGTFACPFRNARVKVCEIAE